MSEYQEFTGKSVEEALKSFTLAPGFRIEVVASDPMIEAPVEIEFDPDGRMNPSKVLPDGAHCGDFAAARGDDAARVAEELPEGAWI